MSTCDRCGKASPTLHSCDGDVSLECLACHDRLYKDVIIGLAGLLRGRRDIHDLPASDIARFLARMGPPTRCDYTHVLDVIQRSFVAWVQELVEHHGERQVKDVLGSTAILSMFDADVSQAVMSSRP